MYDVSYNADNVLYDRQETLFMRWKYHFFQKKRSHCFNVR